MTLGARHSLGDATRSQEVMAVEGANDIRYITEGVSGWATGFVCYGLNDII